MPISPRSSLRNHLYRTSSLLAVVAGVAAAFVLSSLNEAKAQCLTVNSGTTITNSGTNCITWNAGNISITNSGTLTAATTAIGNPSSNSAGTLTNSGLINSSKYGFNVQGTIASIVNNATIIGNGASTSDSAGIYIPDTGNPATITAIINNVSASITGGWNGIEIQGNNSISTLANSGFIAGGIAGNAAYAAAIENIGWIGLITNASTGTIQNILSNGIMNDTGTIGTIINSGSILAPALIAIDNVGTITAIINNVGATIGTGQTAIVNNPGVISTIINSGYITGGLGGLGDGVAIDNSGVIGLLSISSTGTISNTNTTNAALNNAGGGSISTINNQGTISGRTAIGNGGIINSIINSGKLIGGLTGSTRASGVIENTGSIGLISNLGLISNGNTNSVSAGIENETSGHLGTISNSGLISAQTGILNGGTISAIVNSGLIAAPMAVLTTQNSTQGTILGAVTNSGTIEGNIYVQQTLTVTGGSPTLLGTLTGYNNSIGTITVTNLDFSGSANQYLNDILLLNGGTGTLTNAGFMEASNPITGGFAHISNAGTVAGNISTSQTLTITGGSAGTLGTLTGYNGSIGTITANNLVFDANAHQLLNDNVTVGGGTGTLTSAGALQVNKTITISGAYSQTGTLGIGVTSPSSYGELVISGAATLTNDVISLTSLGAGFTPNELLTIVQASSTGSNFSGITITAGGLYGTSISSIVSGGTDDLVVQITCPTYSNAVISGSVACANWTSGNLSIASNGIVPGVIGVTASVGTLTSAGSIGGLSNSGAMASLSNSGVVAGSAIGVNNASAGSIGTLSNSGTISGSSDGIANTGTITGINNNGTLTGGAYGILNTGTIGSLANNGAISAAVAINSTGTILSALSNAGTIAGNISASQTLTLTGGSAGTLGTLTGYNGSIGTITANNLVFDANAHQLLNDNVTVGSGTGTLTSAGALQVNKTITISGAYSQTGTLGIGVTSPSSYGELVISGAATLTNDVISLTSLGAGFTPNELLTIVQASSTGSNFSGITISTGGLFGTSISSIVSGGTDDLVVQITCPSYSNAVISSSVPCVNWNSGNLSIASNGSVAGDVGATATVGTLTNAGSIGGLSNSGAMASLSNNGVVAGSAIGVNNASAGSIGTLSNNGTISGSSDGIANTGTITGINNNGTLTGGAYGILNTGTIGSLANNGAISAAVAINSTGTILSALSNAGTIAGNISASQTLTITGGSAGTLGTLTGYNGSIGTITANNLVFDTNAYQLLNDNVTVGGGTGTLTSAGTLQVNKTITVSGAYSQTGTLRIGVTSPSTYGELVISGVASMSGAHVTLVPLSGMSFASGETFTIVQASSTNTNYSGVTASANGYTTSISSSVVGPNDDLIVSLTQPITQNTSQNASQYTSIASSAGGGVAPAMGGALDQIQTNITNGGTTEFQTVLNSINALPNNTAKVQAIQQLAPTPMSPSVTTARIVASTFHVIEQHQDTLLPLSPSHAPTRGSSAGSASKNSDWWAQFDGGQATRNSTADAAGYNEGFYGMTFGLDHQVTKHTVLGGAFNWTQGSATGNGGLANSALTVNSFQLMAYTKTRFNNLRPFIDTDIGVGLNEFSQSRAIDFLGSTAAASYSGTQYSARVDGGYDFSLPNSWRRGAALSNMFLTPEAGVQYSLSENNGYQESGAGVSDLTVKQQVLDSYASFLGGKVTTTGRTYWGQLSPEVKLMWLHEFGSRMLPTTATLDGITFTTQTPRIAANGAEISLGLSLQHSDMLSFRVEYDGDIRSDYQSHMGLAKVKLNY